MFRSSVVAISDMVPNFSHNFVHYLRGYFIDYEKMGNLIVSGGYGRKPFNNGQKISDVSQLFILNADTVYALIATRASGILYTVT